MRQTITANRPGTDLARYVMALANTKSAGAAAQYAEKLWKDSPAVHLTLNAAVAEQSLTSDSSLAQFGIAQEFFVLFQQASLVGRLAAQMRPAPFRVKVPAEDSSGTNCSWVPESGLKPLVALSMQSLTVEEFKLALIVAISQELARMSQPSAEDVVRRILVANTARFVDSEFLSSNAGVVGESPAGIGNGQQSQVSSGGTVANIAADVSAMAGKLTSWTRPTWITRGQTYQYLCALDMVKFAGAQPMFSGFPIYWSEASPAQIMLIDLGAILYADDGRSEISIGEHCTLTMDDGASPASASSVSMFQNNLVALRVERYISWLAGHDHACVCMPVTF